MRMPKPSSAPKIAMKGPRANAPAGRGARLVGWLVAGSPGAAASRVASFSPHSAQKCAAGKSLEPHWGQKRIIGNCDARPVTTAAHFSENCRDHDIEKGGSSPAGP